MGEYSDHFLGIPFFGEIGRVKRLREADAIENVRNHQREKDSIRRVQGKSEKLKKELAEDVVHAHAFKRMEV